MIGGMDDTAEAGRAALGSGDWSAASDALSRALETGARDPELLDGLARALWWQGGIDEAIDRRREAYTIFRRRGASERAARIALWLAREHEVLGRDAVARGWLARAERLCEELPPGAVHGWLALGRTDRSTPPVTMERFASEALTLARAHGDGDLEIRALARLGLAAVSAGRVDDGLTLFGEAMAAATGGEATQPEVLGETYCDMFLAVELAWDAGPFAQWSEVTYRFVMENLHAPGLAFCGSCCGELFASSGDLAGAERELLTSLKPLEERGHDARCVHPAAKLAELRVVQGRFEEAERLLEPHRDRPDAVRARVALATARGEYAVAGALLERRLNALGTDSLLSLPLLAQLHEVHIAKGDLEGADAIGARLDALALSTEHPRASAEAARAAGRSAAARGDESAALRDLERSLGSFDAMSKPIEAARTRMMLAEVLVAVDATRAADEARTALATFERIGATREADGASSLVRALTGEGRAGPKGFGTLSKRELEVAALVAEGLSNAQIAERLFISVKTAGNHVSSILMKLGCRSRAEIAAWYARDTSKVRGAART